ncbi:MAG: transketolase C-terminal domain-containing protein, partial [Gammaproteobacteria bacterium]
AKEKGTMVSHALQEKFKAYQHEYGELASEFERRLQGELPNEWLETTELFLQQTVAKAESNATRKASQNCLEAYGPILPELLGGSADLASSNNTFWSGSQAISHAQQDGNYIYYGVREFAMSAIMNGLALHGGFIPYGGTFLVFCDYARNAVRLAAMMKQRVIFVYTHDSIGLGEDGPTHQPIEHAAILRLTPNMSVWRPCDSVETTVAWQVAIERSDGPTSLLFSRQKLPCQSRDEDALRNIRRGGYILRDCDTPPELILIATGSEVDLAMQASEILQQQGWQVRVVSLPAVDVFSAQSEAYRESVLPKSVMARIAVEAAAGDYWYKFVGLHGAVIGLDRFGESAPAAEVFQSLGITVGHIVEKAQALLEGLNGN